MLPFRVCLHPPPRARPQLGTPQPPSRRQRTATPNSDCCACLRYDMDQPMPDPDEAPPQGGPPETAAVTAAAADKPQFGSPAAAVSDESAELYFLIANFLTNASPCSRAAAVLQQELVSDTREHQQQ